MQAAWAADDDEDESSAANLHQYQKVKFLSKYTSHGMARLIQDG